MAMVHLPDDLAQQLEAEAARRGTSVEALAVAAIQGRYGTTGTSTPTPWRRS